MRASIKGGTRALVAAVFAGGAIGLVLLAMTTGQLWSSTEKYVLMWSIAALVAGMLSFAAGGSMNDFVNKVQVFFTIMAAGYIVAMVFAKSVLHVGMLF